MTTLLKLGVKTKLTFYKIICGYDINMTPFEFIDGSGNLNTDILNCNQIKVNNNIFVDGKNLFTNGIKINKNNFVDNLRNVFCKSVTAYNINTNAIQINGKTIIDKNMNITCDTIACDSLVNITGTKYFAFTDRTTITPRDIQIKGNVDFEDNIARFLLPVISWNDRPDITVAKDGQIHVDPANVTIGGSGEVTGGNLTLRVFYGGVWWDIGNSATFDDGSTGKNVYGKNPA